MEQRKWFTLSSQNPRNTKGIMETYNVMGLFWLIAFNENEVRSKPNCFKTGLSWQWSALTRSRKCGEFNISFFASNDTRQWSEVAPSELVLLFVVIRSRSWWRRLAERVWRKLCWTATMQINLLYTVTLVPKAPVLPVTRQQALPWQHPFLPGKANKRLPDLCQSALSGCADAS